MITIKINTQKFRKIIIAIIISLLIEIFICNFPAFRTLLVTNKNLEKDYVVDNKTIIISNIDERVTNINIDYKNKLMDKITYNVKYLAEESSDVVSLKPKVILEKHKQYINLDTHSKCKTIQIDLETENNIGIDNIILNHINFNINIYRIFIIFILVIFIMKLRDESIYQVNYDKDSKFHNNIFTLNLITFCLLIFLYTISQYDFDSLLFKPEDINKEDSILMQTEAFVSGKVELLEEASEELKNMENPYDSVKRSNDGIDYLYDVAYYNGNYYNYFGVAPILTSILPFRLITGMYAHTYIFNFVYILGIALALSCLYKKLIARYVSEISLCNYYLGFYAIFFGANILTLLRGMKYDIVVSSGIMFLLISINLAISIYENKEYKYFKLMLLGITTALVVLSKPNLIIYYLLILFFVLVSMKNKTIKEKIKDSVFILVPLGLFAVFQMILNYLRFDNILEFGAKYQLTGFNMTSCMSLTFGKIYAGIMEYIFKIPTINPLNFPFVFVNTDISLTAMNEICYENRLYGLIAIPILWIYLFINNIFKKTENKEFKNFIKLCILTSVLSLIINTCFGGICEAYAIDFKLIFSIGAVMLLFKFLEQNKDNKDINKIFLIVCIATICLMIPISLTTEQNFLINLRSSITVFLKNMFEFWS